MSTNVTDVIQPGNWASYIIRRTAELFAFIQSGAIQPDPRVRANIGDGNRIINAPNWADLSGKRTQVISDSAALTVNKIVAENVLTPVFERGEAFGVDDLAKWRSGDNPGGAIVDQMVDYWMENNTIDVMAILEGMMQYHATNPGVLYADHCVGDHTAAFTSDLFYDAQYKLNDNAERVALIVCPPAVMKKMKKDDEITFIQPSQTAPAIPFYKGIRVLVTRRAVWSTSGGAATVLMAPAAMTFAEQENLGSANNNAADVRMETDRDILAGKDYITSRRRYVYPVQGVSFTGTIAGDLSVTDALLKAYDSWTKVWPTENIRLAAVLSNDTL